MLKRNYLSILEVAQFLLLIICSSIGSILMPFEIVTPLRIKTFNKTTTGYQAMKKAEARRGRTTDLNISCTTMVLLT